MVAIYILRRKADIMIEIPEMAIVTNPRTYERSYDIMSTEDVPEHAAIKLNGMEGSRETVWERLAAYKALNMEGLQGASRVMAVLGQQE